MSDNESFAFVMEPSPDGRGTPQRADSDSPRVVTSSEGLSPQPQRPRPPLHAGTPAAPPTPRMKSSAAKRPPLKTRSEDFSDNDSIAFALEGEDSVSLRHPPSVDGGAPRSSGLLHRSVSGLSNGSFQFQILDEGTKTAVLPGKETPVENESFAFVVDDVPPAPVANSSPPLRGKLAVPPPMARPPSNIVVRDDETIQLEVVSDTKSPTTPQGAPGRRPSAMAPAMEEESVVFHTESEDHNGSATQQGLWQTNGSFAFAIDSEGSTAFSPTAQNAAVSPPPIQTAAPSSNKKTVISQRLKSNASHTSTPRRHAPQLSPAKRGTITGKLENGVEKTKLGGSQRQKVLVPLKDLASRLVPVSPGGKQPQQPTQSEDPGASLTALLPTPEDKDELEFVKEHLNEQASLNEYYTLGLERVASSQHMSEGSPSTPPLPSNEHRASLVFVETREDNSPVLTDVDARGSELRKSSATEAQWRSQSAGRDRSATMHPEKSFPSQPSSSVRANSRVTGAFVKKRQPSPGTTSSLAPVSIPTGATKRVPHENVSSKKSKPSAEGKHPSQASAALVEAERSTAEWRMFNEEQRRDIERLQRLIASEVSGQEGGGRSLVQEFGRPPLAGWPPASSTMRPPVLQETGSRPRQRSVPRMGRAAMPSVKLVHADGTPANTCEPSVEAEVAELLGVAWPPSKGRRGGKDVVSLHFQNGTRLTQDQTNRFYQAVQTQAAGRVANQQMLLSAFLATSSPPVAPSALSKPMAPLSRSRVLREVFDVLDMRRCGVLHVPSLPTVKQLLEQDLTAIEEELRVGGGCLGMPEMFFTAPLRDDAPAPRRHLLHPHGSGWKSYLKGWSELSSQVSSFYSFYNDKVNKGGRHDTIAASAAASWAALQPHFQRQFDRLRRRALLVSLAVNVVLPICMASQMGEMDFASVSLLVLMTVDGKHSGLEKSAERVVWREILDSYFDVLCVAPSRAVRPPMTVG